MLSVFNVTEFTDNACISIYPIGRDFVAASESDVVLSFDPETLETKDRVSGGISLIAASPTLVVKTEIVCIFIYLP